MRKFIQLVAGNPVAWSLTGQQVSLRAPTNTSFPSQSAAYETVDLAEFGFETFVEVTQPTFNPVTHRVEEGLPIQINGVWTQQWDVVELSPELAASNLAAIKAAKWEAIKTKRDLLSDQGGYKVVVEGVDKWFHSDGKSKLQQLSLFVMGASVPPVLWKTMDGTFVTMTQALAAAIFNAAAAQDMALFSTAETHKADMEASADPAAYNVDTAWPETFTGS